MACKLIVSKRPWTLLPRLLFPTRSAPQKTKYLPQAMSVRCSGLLPPTQYDSKFPPRMTFPTVIVNNWEVIPLFFCTGVGMALMFGAIVWAIKNKVDVKSPRRRNNISRTMDLLNPTSHKIIMIEQKYDPWPEMAEVLHKMKREASLRKYSGIIN